MNKSRLVNLITFALIISSLSGCFWPRYGEHRSGGEQHGEQRGESDHHSDEGRR